MKTKTYEATIKLPSGAHQKVPVDADNPYNAKQMLEAQYGKGSIIIGPTEKRR